MATITGYLTPDYDGTLAVTGSVGTIATTAATGAIVVGKHRIMRIYLNRQTSPSNANEKFTVRFTMGNSVTGHTAPTPTSSSPFITTDNIAEIDTGDAYDSINLANLAADNSAITLGYTVLLMSKF